RRSSNSCRRIRRRRLRHGPGQHATLRSSPRGNFWRKRFRSRSLRDTVETVLRLAYGLHSRPGQEYLSESGIGNARSYSINGLDGELDTGTGRLQVVLPCLRPGEQVSGLPGESRVANLPGKAQGLAAIRLSLAPLPGSESDLTTQGVEPRDVLHRAGGSG